MDDVAKLITDDSFISDCCRFSEGILSEATVKHRWRKVVSETDWATMGSNDEAFACWYCILAGRCDRADFSTRFDFMPRRDALVGHYPIQDIRCFYCV